MAIRAQHIIGAALAAGLACGLGACMQDGARQTASAVAPQTTVPGFGLYYMDEGASAKLAYGRANSDDVDLMLECAKGSRVVEVTNVARDGAPKLILASAGARDVLNAQVESGEGATLLVAHAPVSATAFTAFRRSGRLAFGQGDARYSLAANADERAGVERFFTACEKHA